MTTQMLIRDRLKIAEYFLNNYKWSDRSKRSIETLRKNALNELLAVQLEEFDKT